MNNRDRREESLKVRVSAATRAAHRAHPRHVANGDEQRLRNPAKKSEPIYAASFTKGMPHSHCTGLILDPADFQQFVKAIDSGDPRDFQATRLGPLCCADDSAEVARQCAEGNEDDLDGRVHYSCPWKSKKAQEAEGMQGAKVRAWESQGAGKTFDLEGPDAQAVTMPPAPALGSVELIAEITEVYAQALLRDVPFTKIVDGSGVARVGGRRTGRVITNVADILRHLNALEWLSSADAPELTPDERARKRHLENGKLDGQTAFRGITPGDTVGPYISQFLLAGNASINGKDKEPILDAKGGKRPRYRQPSDGLISYGALTIDQRVRYATPGDDHMTSWDEWFDVQQGADLRGLEKYDDACPRRFITTPRDLATYVHYDALYEAYLNACLILLGEGVPFDPDIPFQGSDFVDHQQGFAHFGGPHILSLVTEVATRALKAVRYQKFNVHRRLRPEALAARLSKYGDLCIDELNAMVKAPGLKPILRLIARKNGNKDSMLKTRNYLLPMAFAEGSPMHPSYGAGHATVAGACVTILKAFFDHHHPLAIAGDDQHAFEPTIDGTKLTCKKLEQGRLTVEGELNKLASNISIGRNWAGVHYFSDYIESLRMGEQIAIGILEEQKLMYGENFSMTVPLYDGGSIRI